MLSLKCFETDRSDSRERERERETNVPAMPSAAPLANTSNGSLSANDNIRRFAAPSRPLTPLDHTLFHNKTRCFV